MAHALVFAWHPEARLWDAKGRECLCPSSTGTGVLDDRPAATALAAAMTRPFRIGGSDPLAAGVGQFETLTAGSSGTPRRVLRRMESWTASFAVNAQLFGIGPGAKVAVLGRLVHSLSLYAGIEALHLGAEAHLLDTLRPDRQRAAMAERQITHLYATPAQLRLLTLTDGPLLPDLLHIITGGSKLDPILRQALSVLAPKAQITEFYGAAEASFITISDATSPEASVGRPYPGVEIGIRHLNTPAPEGEIGQIWTRSPYAFIAYGADDPGGAIWDGDWLSVGEMGRMAGGHLYLAGRAGRMVIVADQNVFPEEIETWLMTQAGVTRAAVLPQPDAKRGAVLIAVLQGEPTCEIALVKAARAHLGPLKAPKQLIWRQDWPSLPSGKTDLQRLARELP